MPLLDSFKVDHTRMNAPAVRVAKTMRTPKGDDITVFDLRFCIPNKEILPPKGIHTLEEAHEIAKNVIARGVGINKNDDLALDESFLK